MKKLFVLVTVSILLTLFFVHKQSFGAVIILESEEALVNGRAFSEIYNEIDALKRTRPHEAIEQAVVYLNQPENLTENQRYSLLFVTGEAFAALDLSLTAIDAFTSSINYAVEHAKPFKVAGWLMELGNLYYRERDFAKADSVYLQCLALYKQVEGQDGYLGMATSLSNRALVKSQLNLFEEAESLLNEALKFRLQTNKSNHVAFNYISLADLYLKYSDRFFEAKEMLTRADSLLNNDKSDFDNPKYKGMVNEYFGDYSIRTGDNGQAVIYYKKALEAYEKRDTRLMIRVLLKLFSFYKNLENNSEALIHLDRAFVQAKEHGSFLEQRRVLETRHIWYKERNDLKNSLLDAEEITKLIDQNVATEREIALRVGQLNRQVAQLDLNLLKERSEKINAEVNRNYAFLALILFFIGGFIWFLKVQSDKKNALIIQQQKEALFVQELEAEKWRSLRLQLKPHFLYNVLSSLRALIQIDAQAAVKMTEHLSKYFRQILDAEQTEAVLISSEIASCQEYLALQSIRFNNEIGYSIELDETLAEYKIPSMLLFPIVENAVKYGYKTSPSDMLVSVKVDRNDTDIRFTISNKGKWIEPRTDYKDDLYEGGLGFRNIKIRLKHHYENYWTLNQKERLGFVTVEVLIRLDKLTYKIS